LTTEDRKIAVFLDRDGTVIVDKLYLADPEGVELLPDAGSAIFRLNRRGIKAILVTNQSGVARGCFTRERVDEIHRRLLALLAGEGARLDAIYYCPHLPPEELPAGVTPCDCRKPDVGLVQRARDDHGLDLHRSFCLGDRLTDVEMALRMGGTGILVKTGYGENALEAHDGVERDFHVRENIADAVDLILSLVATDRT